MDSEMDAAMLTERVEKTSQWDDIESRRRAAFFASLVLLVILGIYTALQAYSYGHWATPGMLAPRIAGTSVLVSLFTWIVVALYFAVNFLRKGTAQASSRVYYGSTLTLLFLQVCVWLIHIHFNGSQNTVGYFLIPIIAIIASWLLSWREALALFLLGNTGLCTIAGLEYFGILPYAPLLNRFRESSALFLSWQVIVGNLVTYLSIATFFLLTSYYFQRMTMRGSRRLRGINQLLEREMGERKQAEEALAESEHRYQLLAESMSDIIWTANMDLRFTYVSPSVERLIGYAPEELVGKSVLEHLSEASIETATRSFLLAMEEVGKASDHLSTSTTMELKRRHKDGSEVWAEVSFALQVDRRGNFIGIVGGTRDITARRHAEEALRVSEERHRLVVENATDAIVVIQDGRIVFTNRRAEERTGWTQEDLISKPFTEVVHPDDREMIVKNHLKRLEGEKLPFMYAFRFLDKEGHTRWAEINSLLIDWAGKPATLNFLQEITHRKEAEAALQESEEKFSRIFRYSPTGMVITTLSDGRIIAVNRAFETITGYVEKDVLNYTSLKSGFWIRPEDRQEATRLLAETGSFFDREFSYRNRSGEIRLALISAVTVNILGVPCIVTSLQDITESRRLEQEQAILEEKFNRAKRMESLGLLAGGVAHDLNNILSGMVTVPEVLMLEDDLPADLRDTLAIINESGERAAAVVDDLLTVCRGIASRKVPLDLNHLIQRVLQSPECLHLRGMYPNIRFDTDLDPDLWHIHASAVHIHKSLVNLLTNAAEAIKDEGAVTIRTRNEVLDRSRSGYEEIPPGEYAVLDVSDTGTGFSGEDIDRIFEPFYTRKILGRSGTGLGLSVVWNTMRDHGASIDLSSGKGGTTFSFCLPMTGDPLPSEGEHDSLWELRGNGEAILVVDDEERQRTITTDLLRRLNYKAVAVCSGEEAVEHLKEHSADLMILDMIMDPGISGRKTYELVLRQNPAQKAIITSGYSETVEVSEALRLGAAGYIKKPFTLKKIATVIRETLEG